MGLGGRDTTNHQQKQSAGITVCVGRKGWTLAVAWWIAVRPDGGEAHCHRSEFAPTEPLAIERLKQALAEEGVVLATSAIRREETGMEYNPARWHRAQEMRLLSGAPAKKTDSKSKNKPMVNKWQQERSYKLPKAATVDGKEEKAGASREASARKPKFNLKLA